MIGFKLAKKKDIPLCMQFIDEARRHQREQGFYQWTETSPNIENIADDVANCRGYLVTDDDVPFGYVCISFDGEPAYASPEVKWLSEQGYAVIHRLAFSSSGRGKGASKAVFRFACRLCAANGIFSLRIDTHEDNKKMRHIIEREGFTYCGIVYYHESPRMAFEKII